MVVSVTGVLKVWNLSSSVKSVQVSMHKNIRNAEKRASFIHSFFSQLTVLYSAYIHNIDLLSVLENKGMQYLMLIRISCQQQSLLILEMFSL